MFKETHGLALPIELEKNQTNSLHRTVVFSGPLWCCKLVTLPPLGNTHKNVVMFGFHHAITDNMSMLILCDKLVKSINQFIN